MKRKLLSVLLSVSLVATMFVGCGGSDNGGGDVGNVEINFDEDPYEATLMYWVANDARDVDAVEAAFNEITLKELNMKVDLQPITLGTYMQQIQMVLSSDDKLDVFPMFGSNAGTYIASEYIEDLTPYIDNALSETMKTVGEEDVMCCTIGDFLWGIPTMHERSNPTCFIFRTDLLNETGFSADDIKSLDDVTKVYEKFHSIHPEITCYNGGNTQVYAVSTQAMDPLGGGNYGAIVDMNSSKVENYYESELFRHAVEVYYEWAQKGYSSADLATGTDAGEALMRAGNLFSFNSYYKPNTKVEKDSMTGYDTTCVMIDQPICTTQTTGALGYAVSSNAEDPGKAALLLNFIYTNKEANDLMNWGIKDKDYVVLDDGTINYPDGVTYENVGYHQDFGWAQPNQFISYVWAGNNADIWDEYDAFRKSAIVSPAYGFTFDTTPVLDEIAALTNVSDQYAVTLGAGAVDPETGIKEFNDALYEAGLQKVIDEKQRQLDEYLANK